jgi:hypothetical protein
VSGRERTMLIALGVLAVGAAAFFLLTSLGGEDADEQAAPTPVTSPPAAVPAPGAGQPPGEPPRAVTFFGGRDPFVPLVVVVEEVTAPTGEAAEEDGEAPPPEEVPAGEAPVEPVPAGAEEEELPGTTVGGMRVTLIDIVDGDTVQVTVDGETFTVDEDEEFAENFQLVSVSGNCARFLFGDESFTLCQGKAPK